MTAKKSDPQKELREKLKAALPPAGEGRCWTVKITKGVATNPITLVLVEQFKPGSPMGETLLQRRTKATVKHITETAEEMLVDVGDYLALVGSYGDDL